MLIGENRGALTPLVSKTVTQGGQSCMLWNSNIESTSQALQLANHNASNRDCDSISINRTGLIRWRQKRIKRVYHEISVMCVVKLASENKRKAYSSDCLKPKWDQTK